MTISTIAAAIDLFEPKEIQTNNVTALFYDNGGRYNSLNEKVYKKATGTPGYKDEPTFIKAINQYLNEEKATATFLGSGQLNVFLAGLTAEQIFNNPYLASLVIGAISNNTTFDSINGEKISLDLDSENTTKITEYIITAVREDELNERIGKVSPAIEYILDNGYDDKEASYKVSELVEDKINNLDEILITVNAAGTTPLISTDVDIIDSESYHELRPVGLSEKKIRQLAFEPGEWQKTKDKIDLISTSFPKGAFGNNEAALEVLRTDNSLRNNKDIRTYQFELYKEVPNTDPWYVISSLYPKISPQEAVKIKFEDKYAEFVIAILEDYSDDEQLQKSVGKTFSADDVFDDAFIEKIYKMIAVDKELIRRVTLFNLLADKSTQIDAKGGDRITPEEIAAIEVETAKAFAKSNIATGEGALSKEQIEARQKFYKQCALLLNIKKLSTKFEEKIKTRQASVNPDGPSKDKPFGGRFWRATSENKESLMTNLVSSEDSSYMFEIPPHIMTQLTPKFRLYKVMNDQSGKLLQTEFIFPRFTDLNRDKNFKKNQGTKHEGEIPTFLEAQFDKGDGMGLKSFSISFNGTNPAEARNDIKGEMGLFFQSFADFTRKRISNNGKEYRFVDLIIQPTPDEKGVAQGIELVTLRQYEPTFYRIRVDMGYNIPKKGDIEGISEDDLTSLQNALKSMNKSYYLSMIDHEFNIKNDGTVEMKFTYRAYLETALKSLRFDALTTPELAKKRIDNSRKLVEIAKNKKCTKDELKELQLSLAATEEVLVLNALNSIMRRLVFRRKIFNVNIDNEDRKFFLNNGFFKSCDFDNGAVTTVQSGGNSGDLGIVLDENFLSDGASAEFKRDLDDTKVQFFFFGDLLHTILDTLYDPDTKSTAVGLENTKIVLGSFDFDPYQGTGSDSGYNISNIPISVDFFGEWFKENVINQKSSRRTFPILNFIRNLSNYIISNGLLETCVNRNVENSIMFQTGQISVVSGNKKDPLSEMVNVSDSPIIDTDSQRGDKNLPLNGDTGGSPNVEDFYHYIVLNTNGSSLTYAGKGNYAKDIESGRFHVEIGSNRGIVKTVKFSKTNMQYLREARFMRNGVDGLLQLSSVYKANVEMFGNTLFYPGMELWINPYGFGGLPLGRPQDGANSKGGSRSLANMLGLGGYHTIVGVTTNLSPNGFTTSLDAQHYYSGDGEAPESVEPKAFNKQNENDLIEMGVNQTTQTGDDASFCEAQILNEQNFNLDAASGTSSTPRIEAPTPAAP